MRDWTCKSDGRGLTTAEAIYFVKHYPDKKDREKAIVDYFLHHWSIKNNLMEEFSCVGLTEDEAIRFAYIPDAEIRCTQVDRYVGFKCDAKKLREWYPALSENDAMHFATQRFDNECARIREVHLFLNPK